MQRTLAYRRRSAIAPEGDGWTIALATDLRRDRVAFDDALRHPSRFREGFGTFLDALLIGGRPRLIPCDPIVEVGPESLTFEGFRGDESALVRLELGRDAFADEAGRQSGTTHFDTSRGLIEGLQVLRGYRPTRLRIDPGEAGPDADPEEAVEPSPSWLRGYLGLQAAMTLPLRRVRLGRDGLYRVLAFLDRHASAKGPRALRFESDPGRPPALVLEPWGERIDLPGDGDGGQPHGPIRVLGRERLRPLARLLPLVDEADVFLLGDALPSFWSIRAGEIRLTLGLAGRTLGDRSAGPGAARLAPPKPPGRYLAGRVAVHLRAGGVGTLGAIAGAGGGTEAEVLAALHQLAGLGQVARELPSGSYRRRTWLDPADLPGGGDPESVAAREIARTRSVLVTLDRTGPDGVRALEGRVLERPVALKLDPDSRALRARCSCSHRAAAGSLCRHLLALVEVAGDAGGRPATLEAWYASFPG